MRLLDAFGRSRGVARRSPRWPELCAEPLERRELLAVTVTRTSLNLRFSTDPTAAQPQEGEYQTFAVTNSGPATYADVWFRATDFVPGQKVQLGAGEDGLYKLGALAPGETKTAFIYMVATTFTNPPGYEYQYFTAEAWDGNPSAGTSTRIAFENEQIEWVGEAIVNASSVKTSSVSVAYFFGATPTSVPVVGGTMVMTVTGRVYNKPDRILFTPASSLDWPADTFELASAVVTYSNPPQLPPDIIFEKPIPPASTPKDFSVVYTFNIEGTTAAPTPVTASQYTANGVQTPLNRKFENSRLLDGVADIPVPQEPAALEITKTGTATAVAGSTTPCSYTITVGNVSGYTAEGVTVTDAWPPNFSGARTFVIPAGTTVTETPTGFTWNIGTLASGPPLPLVVNFTVPVTTAPGFYTDTATVSSTTANPNPTKTVTATTNVVTADLTITKVGDAATVTPGPGAHWYRITVTNTSGFTAENVKVVDTWPAAFPKSAITPPAGTTITGETATGFTWNIGTILSGALPVVLQVGFTVPLGTPFELYTNTAVVSSTTRNLGEKTAIATTLVEPTTTPGLVVSSDDGCNTAFVQLMTADGIAVGPILKPYGNVCGGCRAAAGDINGDGVDELIVAPGRGIAGPVLVYPLGANTPSTSFYPYGTAYRGGIELACADVNDDGRKDIITGMSLGIGTVNAYTVNGVPSLYRTFRGAPAGYAGGVRIAAADFGTYQNGVLVSPNRDGKAEVVVGPNAGSLAQVGIYDLSPAMPKRARTIVPFGPGFTGGVTLSTGNYDGDPEQIPDIFVGAGIGRQSFVSVFNAQTGGQIGGSLIYFSSFARPNAAVNIQPLDLDGDGMVDNLYGVQGLSGGGGTRGVRRVQLGVTPIVTTLQNYLPPLRIKAVNLVGYPSLRVVRPR